MMTIDPERVAADANTQLGLTSRQTVVETLAYDARVNHIEAERTVAGRAYVTVEMGGGEWLTVPAEALIRR